MPIVKCDLWDAGVLSDYSVTCFDMYDEQTYVGEIAIEVSA